MHNKLRKKRTNIPLQKNRRNADMTPFAASFLLSGREKNFKKQEEFKMVEFLVTKGKLVVRNGDPLIVMDGEEKGMSKSEFILLMQVM